ncbi:MAG: copper resistance CopC family protein, partial [Nitrososphaeraceae archaeon]
MTLFQLYNKNKLMMLSPFLGSFTTIIVLILICGTYNQSLYAHANPISYSPTSNSVIDTVGTLPEKVVIAYSERPELKASYIRVTNSENERVDKNDYKISNSNARESSVSMDTSKLKPGIYTVSWLALSKDDGHITKGSYVFTVTTTMDKASDAASSAAPSAATTNATKATNAFVDSVIVDNVNITYGISPFYSGVNNNFTVAISDSNGNTPTNIKTVFLIFNNEQAGLGPISAELAKGGEGEYGGSGGFLSQPGKWEVE